MHKIVFIGFLLLSSCNDLKKESFEENISYNLFYEVGVKVEPESEKLSFYKIREKFSPEEILYLEQVLLDLNWGYKVTKDSCVLIFSHYISNIHDMHDLNNEWKLEMQKNQYSPSR